MSVKELFLKNVQAASALGLLRNFTALYVKLLTQNFLNMLIPYNHNE